jgi:UDP-glucose 4,6-dehydratase
LSDCKCCLRLLTKSHPACLLTDCSHPPPLPPPGPRSPKFTLRASRGLELPIHGDGLAVRSYLYVEDVAEAYITVLLKGKVGETYNIGTQKERSVVDVATDICKFFKLDPATHVQHVKDRVFNDRRYFM